MMSYSDFALATICLVGITGKWKHQIHRVTTEHCTAVVILCRFIGYPNSQSPFQQIPGPPKKKLLAQLKEFPHGGIPVDFFRQWANEYGPIFRLAGGPLQGLVVSSPTGVQRVFVNNSSNYQIPMKELLDWSVGGFFILPSKEHKERRKTLHPVFSLNNLISNTGLYYKTTESLIKIFHSKIHADPVTKNGNVIPVYTWMGKLALDNVCEGILGFQLDSLHNPSCELTRALDDLESLPAGTAVAPWGLLVRIPGFFPLVRSDWVRHSTLWHRTVAGRLGPFFIFMRCLSTLRKTALAVKAKRMQEEDPSKPVPDAISILKDLQTSGCTDADIEGNIIMFWSAGRATVASRISWALWLLANDQQCQKRVRDEVTALFSRDPRPDYRSLDDLKWLDCIIMESLRLFSFGSIVRVAENDDYIDGVFVPKGTPTIIPLDLLNVRTNIWGEDGDKFNPARWLDTTKKLKTSPPFLSFLTGPHRCLAKAMALVQMKIVISSLIANFEFEPAYYGQQVEGTPLIVKDGLPVRVKPVHPLN